MLVLEVLAVLLAAVAMALSLAHALEYPGKLRLDRETYMAVQTIYYPGFTIGGFSEILAIVAVLALLVLTPADGAGFGWTLASLLALVLMHGAYWLLTHPVNRFWLKDQKLSGAGGRFFAVGGASAGDADAAQWTRYRDRWELSHVVRAILGLIGLATLVVAAAL